MEVVQVLIKAGADAMAQDENGHNPLHLVVGSKSPQVMEVVQELIEAGADAKAQDRDGRNPLHNVLDRWGPGPQKTWRLYERLLKRAQMCRPGTAVGEIHCMKR
jgi:hypothetical protein